MNRMNVFYWPYTSHYYFTHPLEWFKQLGKNCKDAYQRITRGWCPMDCWNLGDNFLTVMPEMLRYFAEHGNAFPGYGKWDTPEKWSDWLNSIADVMAAALQDLDDYNEFANDFHRLSKTNRRVEKAVDGGTMVTYEESNEFKEVRDLYFERMKELQEERKVSLKSAMNAFSEGIVEGVMWD